MYIYTYLQYNKYVLDTCVKQILVGQLQKDIFFSYSKVKFISYILFVGVLLFIIIFYFILFMCMAVFPVCMSGYNLDAWCLWKSEESVRFPELQVVVSFFPSWSSEGKMGHQQLYWSQSQKLCQGSRVLTLAWSALTPTVSSRHTD